MSPAPEDCHCLSLAYTHEDEAPKMAAPDPINRLGNGGAPLRQNVRGTGAAGVWDPTPTEGLGGLGGLPVDPTKMWGVWKWKWGFRRRERLKTGRGPDYDRKFRNFRDSS